MRRGPRHGVRIPQHPTRIAGLRFLAFGYGAWMMLA